MQNHKIDGHKLNYHPERVAKWLEDKKMTFPLYVEVSPVGHCNHRCSFCALDYLDYKHNTLKASNLMHSITNMSSWGVKSIMYAGEGEPLLHPAIVDIIAYTKMQHIDVAVTSNGVLMNEAFVEGALEHISWIKLSVNAGTEETYKKVHQAGSNDWDKLWKNITYATHYRDINQLKTKIGVQMVVLPENLHEALDLALEAKLAGADYLVLKPYSQHKYSITKQYKDYNMDMYKQLDEIVGAHSDEFFKIICRTEAMGRVGKEHKYINCPSVPYFWAYIMSTGDVYGCSAFLGRRDFSYGNINEKLFSEIWLGERRIQATKCQIDTSNCRENCRMEAVNQYLIEISNPGEHVNFI